MSETFPSLPTRSEPTSVPHKLVITILVLSAFVVILNETILSVAIPHLMSDLGVDEPTVQWVSTAFLLTMAVVIPTTGFLVERLTTRTLYLSAMASFAVGTLVCALAPGIEMLLTGRVIQAFGTAIMMPLLMTTILQLVPVDRRGQVMGIVMVVISVAPALGPTVSGVILQFLEWRFIFWIVLPIALVMGVVGALRLENVSESVDSKLDVLSIPLSALGFGGLVYGLTSMSEGPGSPVLWGSLAVGIVGTALFAWRQISLQRSGRDPLLDLRTLTYQPFRVGLGLIMIGFAALLGVAILWPIYLQKVHGINEILTGALLLPGGLAMGLLGPVIGRLYDQMGAKRLALPAAIVLVLIIFAMSRVTATTPEWLLLLLHLTMSLSLAFMFTPTFTASLNSLNPQLYSHGSATLGALQQVAGAAGTALLMAILASTRTSAEAAGATEAVGTLAGVQLALTVAAGIAIGSVVLAFRLRSGPPTAYEPAGPEPTDLDPVPLDGEPAPATS
ncbi:MDR family MFS transporter [Propionibacteriaceae bacterium Y2011]